MHCIHSPSGGTLPPHRSAHTPLHRIFPIRGVCTPPVGRAAWSGRIPLLPHPDQFPTSWGIRSLLLLWRVYYRTRHSRPPLRTLQPRPKALPPLPNAHAISSLFFPAPSQLQHARFFLSFLKIYSIIHFIAFRSFLPYILPSLIPY